MVQNLGFTALLLGVLVFVHELGHFLVAKAFNVKVLRFSIGFGPKILSFTRGETEYRIAWLPLGGYVKMAGELPHEELSPQEQARGFLTQAPWKRALIVGAGPAFNLVFPILAYFFVFWGAHPAIAARVGSVEPGLPAAAAGLQPGDRILAVDGEKVQSFGDLRNELKRRYDSKIQLLVEREGKTFTTEVETMKQFESDPVETLPRGVIGVSVVAQPAAIGVPEGSVAAKAGLRTFDRIVAVNGKKVETEADLRAAINDVQGTVELKVLRAEGLEVPGANLQSQDIQTVTVERQEGEGYAALGVERADLYVDQVALGSPAAKAGIKAGDRLVSLDGKVLPSYTWFDIALSVLQEKPFTLAWKSGGELKSATVAQVKVPSQEQFSEGTTTLDLGIRPRPFPAAGEPEKIVVHRSVGEALRDSSRIVPEVIRKTALVIGYLFTGKVPFQSVGGPGMLYQVASKSAEEGVDSFLNTMAVISVNLGLMNLLPIPVLDGFALLVAIWEGIRRRPIPMRAREIANMIGLAMLIALMVLVIKNDVTRFMSSGPN